MIPTYSFKEVCSRKKLLELKPQVLNRTWDAKPSNISQKYILAIDPENIYLIGFWPKDADFDANLKSGSFGQGLWQRDVLELFIKDDKSEAYQEFNLSPGGAWWTAVFSAPRVESKTDSAFGSLLSESAVSYQLSESDSGLRKQIAESGLQSSELCDTADICSAILEIKRSKLRVKAAFNEGTRINVTACLTTGVERIYLSAAKLRGEKPDFHQPGCFETMTKG